ncbi:MAG: DUF1499 domain-containing protein [bacterium]|nr:DUF1499 domain-containing protein [bacterium]
MLVARSRVAPELGLEGGALRPCPDSPNCVSSLATDDGHRVEPMWRGDDTLERAWMRLESTVRGRLRTNVVERRADYLWAEFSSSLLGFVDDVEFHLDRGKRVIHVRSASRVGHSNLGANRKRVEALRAELEAALR